MSQGKRTIQTKLNFPRISSTCSNTSTSENNIKKRRLSGDSTASEMHSSCLPGKNDQRKKMDTTTHRDPDKHSAQGSSNLKPSGGDSTASEMYSSRCLPGKNDQRKKLDTTTHREPDKHFAEGSRNSKPSDKKESSPNSKVLPSNAGLDGSQDLFEDEPMDAANVPLPDDDEEEDTFEGRDFVPKKRIESEKPQASSQGPKSFVNELRTAPKCYEGQDNWLKSSNSVQVMFRIPKNGWVDKPLEPYRTDSRDQWNDGFVYMPCSPNSQIPRPDMVDGTCLRWEVIDEALTSCMSSSFDIAEAILRYNSHYRKKWNFENLHCLFTEELPFRERMEILTETLPKMAELARQLPLICTMPIHMLRKYEHRKLVLSQKQVACLLANAFFCTFPRRNLKVRGPLPDINFSSLFNGPRNPRKMQKLKCIFNYFDRVTKKMPNGVVSYERQVLELEYLPEWSKVKEKFTRMCVSAQGTIEDDGIGMLQADFANKYVGGGVLGRGCVQEEIRFVICPEMILSRLFTEVLQDNEVLIMTGCEQFSDYSGYADTFMYEGNHEDKTERDSWGRLCTEVVAMDALVVRAYKDQFTSEKVCRELNKAYCAFKGSEYHENLSAVSTGNWGCGAFGGDKHLKALIQWMAASLAGREIVFFTFGDKKLKEELEFVHEVLRSSGCRVGQAMDFISNYYKHELRGCFGKPTTSLFEFICKCLGKGWTDKPPRAPVKDEDNSSVSDSEYYIAADFNSQDYKANTP